MSRFFFERLIASRMLGQADATGRISRPIVRVAVGGIAAGLAVMILTLAVMTGFQKEIRQKVIGFGSHIQIKGFNTNTSFETDSLNRNQPTVEAVKKLPGIRHVQVFATKAGIIKSSNQLFGVVLKGIDRDFDWSFFQQNLKEGKLFSIPDTVTDQVLVSKYIANKMNLKVGKKIIMFFLRGNETKAATFHIAGIYETDLTEGFDDRFVLCDIRQVQKLNDWDNDIISGFEVLVDDYGSLDKATEEVNNTIDVVRLNAQNIKELTPQIFSWLDALDVNAIVVISLLLFVCMINMISALIILILDRTNMIGTLKSLGAPDRSVIRIFLFHAAKLIGLGMLMGNILGLGLCWLQAKFGIVALDPESYYVKTVPVHVDVLEILALNAATLVLCMVALLIPALIVTRISPVKAIRFS